MTLIAQLELAGGFLLLKVDYREIENKNRLKLYNKK